MPCNTVTTTKIQWSQQTDTDLLRKALIQLGYQVMLVNGVMTATKAVYFGAVIRYYPVDHRMEINTRADTTPDQVKRAYSAQVVKAAAGRFGWQLQETQPGRQFKAARRF